MKILDENGVEIFSPDLEKGYLKEDKIFVAHHEAVEAVEEQWHYETIAEYPNGGKDVEKVVDVPGVEAQEAWDEYEDVLRYVCYTDDQLAEMEAAKEDEESRRPVTWDELDAAYQTGYEDGYKEGVNSAYDE